MEATHPDLPLPGGQARTGLSVRDEVGTPPPDDEVSRRTALKMMSATALLASGAVGCTRKPPRHIVSLSESPEYQDPGTPLYYASTWTEGHWPYGIMVKAADGRPVKIEGLPSHPLNRGTSTASMQASLLSLYDPTRLESPRRGEEAISWAAADKQVVDALRAAKSAVLVTRSLLGPSERAIVARLQAAVPGTRHLVWESIHDGERRRAWAAVFGQDGIALPDLDRARIILSVDSDFLGTDGDVLTGTRQFAGRRRVDGDPQAERLSRLYVAESAMTVTGGNADHRIPLRPSAALAFVRAVAEAVEGGADAVASLARTHGLDAGVLEALVADLRAHRGEAVVLAGPHLPGAVHAAVALLNGALGALGSTLTWDPAPPTLPVDDAATIAAALGAGPDVAVFLDVNPVHDWPGGGFEVLLGKVALTVGHGLTRNETLAACTLALPSAHNLEAWNDAAPTPGVLGLCQPLIAPLYEGRQGAASLLAWTRALAPDDAAVKAADDWYAFVRGRWEAGPLAGAPDTQRAWEDALRQGTIGAATRAPFPALLRAPAAALVAQGTAAGPKGSADVVLVPHGTVGDGRFAGNAWLQELPDPVSRLVWDSAAAIGPALASRLGVEEGEWIRIRVGERTLDLPALVQPGTAPDVVAVALGQGRSAGAGVGNGVGFRASALLGAGITPWLATNAQVARAEHRSHKLVRTQRIFDQNDRPIVLEGTREEYVRDNAFVATRRHVPPLRQLDAEWDYSKGRKWGLAIDLSACTGCNACQIACQAENNVPVVGKDECGMGREMSWIRIDRYEAGDPANPTISQQPMLCQQCDNAPCENVCPVNATAHSPEGLNEQVYNRCVGTRYCANNCPYKVRRFNYFNYTKQAMDAPVRELVNNPQVTVRSRGVMEKCTFCIQRINAGKFAASNAGRPVADGAIRTACQQACPAEAIVFGDLNDEGSAIARKRASSLAYLVLEELNVRPNVSYLAKVRNPHPSVGTPSATGGHR